ncbi:MAG TPA: OmpW family outer membrane protein [Thermoanaerobaculia bacterium]|jgi:outer membrane protein W|nr:OmpW family outer membrane protein [Thermoanaerobaculia bacterium]
MTQRIYRITFLLFIVAGSIRLSAQTQSTEIGGWALATQLKSSTFEDEISDAHLKFDEDNGYGISINQFWTERWSTELAVQTFGAGLLVSTDIVPDREYDAGEIDVTSITAMAQWHFNRAGRFAPYIGGGIAHLSGELTVEVDDVLEDPSTDLEAEIAFAAAIGANIRLTDRLFLATELKYTPWSAVAADDVDGEGFDVNPLVLGVGLKARF